MLKRLLQDPGVTLATVHGVAIRVHLSFLFLPIWAFSLGSNWRGSLFMASFALLLYVCAGLHELGHIAVARRYGARISRIRISGLGAFVKVLAPAGLTPLQSYRVALGGPTVSVWLSVALLIAAWPTLAAHGIMVVRQRDLAALVVALAGTNVLLTAFNLLPVFPMDGGQALSALLARHLRPPQATQVVSIFGQVVAASLVLAAAFVPTDFLIRVAVLATAGLVFWISYRAQRSAVEQPA